MPRSIRQEYAGAVYHAMCRGNNGQAIFRNDKGRRLFLSTLEEICEQTGWQIHAYVLMSNHYHLLLETPEANLVAGMKWFQGTYTQRFNALFKCRGHLFQGRYKALPIETDGDSSYFREVGQYIHLNPFRAGLAGIGMSKLLEQYRWSSYPAYVGHVHTSQNWLHRDRLLSACGLDVGLVDCCAAYQECIESRMIGEVDPSMEHMRDVVEKQLNRGWYIGGDSFRVQLSGMIDGRSDNLRGLQRRSHAELEAERLFGKALSLLKITEEDLLGMKSTCSEKQAIAWLLQKHTTVSVVWVASRLKMGHRTNASRAISAFDRILGNERKALREKMLQCTG